MPDRNAQLDAGLLAMSSDVPYTGSFYDGIRHGSRRSAEVLVPIILELIKPSSVIDVGCGDGTWLSVFRKCGVLDLAGLDGDYVDKRQLQIKEMEFTPTDLFKPFTVGRSFDLAVSFEVAEHLPEQSAPGFIRSLTKTAPVVAFSAAVPLQGGTQHLNEQWPEYWAELFLRHNYVAVDCLRQQIWNNDQVEFWYVQNSLIFCDRALLHNYPPLQAAFEVTDPDQLRKVHPRNYLGAVAAASEEPGVRRAARLLSRAVIRAMRRRTGL